MSTIPFSERGGALRGCLDLLSGRFPAFVFGGSVGSLLPVFHFHDETREELDPKLRHLAENGYRSVTAGDIADYTRGQRSLPARAVALCFDDAWRSLAKVAAPLLERYGLTAITFAIPARMREEPDLLSPLVSWSELARLHVSGVIDVQSHTYTHSMVFTSSVPVDFVAPGYERTPFLNRPQISPPPGLAFVTPDELGVPLYAARSRMSDARRVSVSPEVPARCADLVRREGGAAFFTRAGWRTRLLALVADARSVAETPDEQARAIEEELARSRDELNGRLRTRSVNHICLPWGVSSGRTRALLERVGYRSAFANRMRGMHAVRPGDDPYWLKRLPNRYIPLLPGRGRRYWFSPPSRATAAT